MKFYLFEKGRDYVRVYTHIVLKAIAKSNGHEFVSDPTDADFVIISLCDVQDIFALETLRKRIPKDKKIIAGGHACIFYKVIGLHADYVNVGHGFDFFKCQSEDEFKELDCVYYRGKTYKYIKPSTLIEWEIVPIGRTAPKGYCYWAGTGCKNKCKFCVTSWVNKYQTNDPVRVEKAYSSIPRGSSMILVSNENDFRNKKMRVKAMMVKDFIKQIEPVNCMVRLGIEFATEESRKKYGKPMADDDILRALEVAQLVNADLHLFFIGGVNTREEWKNLLYKFPQGKFKRKIFLKFTNLDVSMFMPLYKERYSFDFNNYLDMPFKKELIEEHFIYRSPAKVIPIGNAIRSIWRMTIENAETMEEYQIAKAWRNRPASDLSAVVDEFRKLDVFKNDYTGEVYLWYKKKTFEQDMNEANLLINNPAVMDGPEDNSLGEL